MWQYQSYQVTHSLFLSKTLDNHHSTVRHTVYKGGSFHAVGASPQSGCPTKMSLKAQYRMITNVINKKITSS